MDGCMGVAACWQSRGWPWVTPCLLGAPGEWRAAARGGRPAERRHHQPLLWRAMRAFRVPKTLLGCPAVGAGFLHPEQGHCRPLLLRTVSCRAVLLLRQAVGNVAMPAPNPFCGAL